MNKIILITAFTLVSFIGYAQLENANWILSDSIRVNFNGDSVNVFYDAAMTGFRESASAISNSKGDILFYSDGIHVWNKQNELMPNGSGLKGHISNSQGVYIIPHPGENDLYYLFSLDGVTFRSNFGLYYSIIDLSLNNGLGDVTDKNILVDYDFTEQLTTIKLGQDSIWVLAQKRNSSSFYSYLITCNGFQSDPLIQSVGTRNIALESVVGSFVVSKNSEFLATSFTSEGRIELFRIRGFGSLEYIATIFEESHSFPYGLCFSPNSRYLYAGLSSLSSDLIQFDLESSTYNYEKIASNVSLPGSYFDIQLGINNALYYTRRGFSYLGSISNPNDSYSDLVHDNKSVSIAPQKIMSSGLQNLVVVPDPIPDLVPPFPPDTTLCTSEIDLISTTPNAQYLWQDGSTDSTFTATTSGIYWVERNVNDCVIRRDSIHVTLGEMPILTRDTTICEGESLIIGDNSITASGMYEDTIYATSSGDCDTIVMIDVDLLPVLQGDTTYIELMPGESSIFEDNTYDTSGIFSFSGVSSSGCDSMYYLVVTLSSEMPPEEPRNDVVYIPNIFSPNGDRTNDELTITLATDLSFYHLRIYDRWGQSVYHSQDPSMNWDGTIKGMDAESGVYIAQVEYVVEGETFSRYMAEAVSVVR